MEVHLSNPELQAKVDRWTAETGRPTDELAEDAIASYLEDVAEVRRMLHSRYDDLWSARVKPISGEELRTRVQEKLRARATRPT